MSQPQPPAATAPHREIRPKANPEPAGGKGEGNSHLIYRREDY